MKLLPAAAFAGCMLVALHLPAEQHVASQGQNSAVATHSRGYLGVDIRDIDTARAAQLKLKDPRGAEIITVDHDAPACKAGLRVHDVILQMNGQPIEGEAQFRQVLRQMPPGRVVSLVISRDGQQQSLSVQLADRSTIEADAWSQHIPVPQPQEDDNEIALPSSGWTSRFGNGFFSGLGFSSAYTGLELDILGPQLADYFGVHGGQGLLVKRVDDNSPAALAGLHAGDVITRVNGKAVASTSQWYHAMRSNRGKPVQLTVFRNKKEQTVTMTAGHSKNSGKVAFPGSFSPQQLARGVAGEVEHLPAQAMASISELGHEIASVYPRNFP